VTCEGCRGAMSTKPTRWLRWPAKAGVHFAPGCRADDLAARRATQLFGTGASADGRPPQSIRLTNGSYGPRLFSDYAYLMTRPNGAILRRSQGA